MSRRRIDVADLGPGAREQVAAATGETPSEEAEQRELVRWADATVVEPGAGGEAWPLGDYLLAIPNGGARHRAEGGKLKAQGVRAGVPDLFLAVPRNGFCGLWIELKRQHGGTVSEAQRSWHVRLEAAGYAVTVARGWTDARRWIRSYLYPDLGDPDHE